MSIQTGVSTEAIVQRLVAAGQPQQIFLFGSRARQQSHSRSDYDLLIVESSPLDRAARAGAYYRALSDLPVEVDIIVVTPEEVREWSQVPQAFITTAIREGRALYERQV
jgi:predicted nucleotidyltransferase